MYRGFKTFEDIKAWQLGREFRKAIYTISKLFPDFEKYCLTSQIRRSAISVTANIAEGFGRYSYQENINFCRIARGSLNETLDHLKVALDEGYITKNNYAKFYCNGREIEKAINGYIKYLKDNREII